MTKIEYVDETWNPITGCSWISEGCDNCYAERMAKRLAGRFGYPKDNPFWVTWHEENLRKPLSWKKPRNVFVCSMGDFFHNKVKIEWQVIIADIMRRFLMHNFLLLTKRPCIAMRKIMMNGGPLIRLADLENVWIGTTCENQHWADNRLPHLLAIDSPRRWVSVEPMLGQVDLGKYLERLEWVVCGPETGPGARPMDFEWAIRLKEQCRNFNVPFFYKKYQEKNTPDELKVTEVPF